MDKPIIRLKWHLLVSATIVWSAVSLAACDNNSSPPATPVAAATLTCDASITNGFKPDANTTVLLVHSFQKGDPLLLSGAASASTPVAANDLCLVKLNVGPGSPGPAGLPSTSPGIGIEIWLPTAANWNNRIHVIGGGGWAGGVAESLTEIDDASQGSGIFSTGAISPPAPSVVAGVEGAVSASTDTGHSNTANGGSFAMNPDGSINTALWNDFAERGIHEMAVETKALTLAYYGKAAKYAYWDGFSTGGRQAHKEAQANPTDFNGILAGAPAFNWTRFITGELYPEIVNQQDLGGVPLTAGQLTLVSAAATRACDLVNGQHLNYIPDPSQCAYDPTKDASVICTANGGANTTASCVSPLQAEAVNKIWYGETEDGTAPDPAVDNDFSLTISGNHLWYGLNRGAILNFLAGPTPFPISSDIAALELQNPAIATPSFINTSGNGANGWAALSYAQLGNAYEQGLVLQAPFANINTDDPDLSAFNASGGKMLLYHGFADFLIPTQGSINYYNRVANQMGGIPAIQSFYRFYLIPGMGHGLVDGTATAGNPPLPTSSQLYAALTNWVEGGTAPGRLDISSPITATNTVVKSRPICPYPQKGTYVSGDVNSTASYTCM